MSRETDDLTPDRESPKWLAVGFGGTTEFDDEEEALAWARDEATSISVAIDEPATVSVYTVIGKRKVTGSSDNA
jgi:hypothetical protein